MQTAPLVRVRRRRPAFGSWLLGIAVAGLLGLIAWQLSSTGHKPAARSPIPETTTTTRRALLPAPRPVPHAVPSVARIALVATRGPCWFSVRLGSRAGRSLYERTLEQGQSARFTGRRLWIRLGAPWNVDARLNGKAIRLPGAIGNVVVTAAGLVRARS